MLGSVNKRTEVTRNTDWVVQKAKPKLVKIWPDGHGHESLIEADILPYMGSRLAQEGRVRPAPSEIKMLHRISSTTEHLHSRRLALQYEVVGLNPLTRAFDT